MEEQEFLKTQLFKSSLEKRAFTHLKKLTRRMPHPDEIDSPLAIVKRRSSNKKLSKQLSITFNNMSQEIEDRNANDLQQRQQQQNQQQDYQEGQDYSEQRNSLPPLKLSKTSLFRTNLHLSNLKQSEINQNRSNSMLQTNTNQNLAAKKSQKNHMSMLKFLNNPHLPLYDPIKFKIPTMNKNDKKPISFQRHPNEEMDDTFNQIFEFQNMKTQEELKSVTEFFEKHPRQFHYDKLSLAQIMEQLYSEKQRQEEDERIRNIAIEAKRIYKQRIASLNHIIKEYKINVTNTDEISTAQRIKSQAKEDTEVFYKYKKNRMKMLDKIEEQKDITDDKAILDLNMLQDIDVFLKNANKLLLPENQHENALVKLKRVIGAKATMKHLEMLKRKAKKQGQEITYEALQAKIDQLREKYRTKKNLKSPIPVRYLNHQLSPKPAKSPALLNQSTPSKLKSPNKQNQDIFNFKSVQEQKQDSENINEFEYEEKKKIKRFNKSSDLLQIDSQIENSDSDNEIKPNVAQSQLLPPINHQNSSFALNQRINSQINLSFQVSPNRNFNKNIANIFEEALQHDNSQLTFKSNKVNFITNLNTIKSKSQINSPKMFKDNSNLNYGSRPQLSQFNNLSHKKLNKQFLPRDKSFSLPASPTVQQLREHIKKYDETFKHRRELQNDKIFKSQTQESVKKLLSDCRQYQQKYIKEDVPVKRLYDYKMFTEDLQLENLDQQLDILHTLSEMENPKMLKLLYFLQSNIRQDFKNETRILAKQVKTGMMDPKRDVAMVEMQNFIKKNIGKRLAMAHVIGDNN
eukprot:403339441